MTVLPSHPTRLTFDRRSTDWNDMFGKGRKRSRVRASDIALPPAVDEHPFTVVRNGWRMAEVAAFVADVSADMTQITPQDLRRATFTVDKRGYDKAEVIAYLNRVAAEIEAELEVERARVRQERLVNLDPSLASEPPTEPGPPSVLATEPALAAEPAPAAEPEPGPEAQPRYEFELIEPAPAPPAAAPEPAPPPQADPGSPEIIWIDVDDLSADVAAPADPVEAVGAVEEPPAPAPAEAAEIDQTEPEPDVVFEVIEAPTAPLPPPPAPPPPPPPPPSPPATVTDASAQISELLRAAHDASLRLRDEAEAEAGRHKARLVHETEMEADDIRRQAERDAAATRAAAEAVMIQAQAEVAKIRAIAHHNLAEIEASRQDAAEKGTELMSLGQGMLAALHGLDQDIAQRLIRTQQIVAMAQATMRESAS